MLAAGSVNKLLPVPGISEYAHGFRGIPEAVYLRDHITRQIALADTTEDQAERTSAAPSWWSAPATPAPRSPPRVR